MGLGKYHNPIPDGQVSTSLKPPTHYLTSDTAPDPTVSLKRPKTERAMETELPFIFEAVAPGQGLDTLARQRAMEPGSAAACTASALWMEIYEAEGHPKSIQWDPKSMTWGPRHYSYTNK